ncbi:MAG: Uncharacterised protein [Flavobacteriia bacterium]|nr:MAG: Uncharacterised protein [Flavobacteriia bacterium]
MVFHWNSWFFCAPTQLDSAIFRSNGQCPDPYQPRGNDSCWFRLHPDRSAGQHSIPLDLPRFHLLELEQRFRSCWLPSQYAGIEKYGLPFVLCHQQRSGQWRTLGTVGLVQRTGDNTSGNPGQTLHSQRTSCRTCQLPSHLYTERQCGFELGIHHQPGSELIQSTDLRSELSDRIWSHRLCSRQRNDPHFHHLKFCDQRTHRFHRLRRICRSTLYERTIHKCGIRHFLDCLRHLQPALQQRHESGGLQLLGGFRPQLCVHQCELPKCRQLRTDPLGSSGPLCRICGYHDRRRGNDHRELRLLRPTGQPLRREC